MPLTDLLSPIRVAGFAWLQQPCMGELAVTSVSLSDVLNQERLTAAARCVRAISAALQVRHISAANELAVTGCGDLISDLTGSTRFIPVRPLQVFELHDEEATTSPIVMDGTAQFDRFVPWMLQDDDRCGLCGSAAAPVKLLWANVTHALS